MLSMTQHSKFGVSFIYAEFSELEGSLADPSIRNYGNVQIDSKSIERALSEFDRVVHRIESCRGKEFYGVGIIDSWKRDPHDPETCKICDARTYCPDYKARYAHQNR